MLSRYRERLWCICYETLYQFPPLGSSVAGILLRVSCIFVADGAKTEPKAEDLLEVEPLVCRVRVMVLRVVFCALVIVLFNIFRNSLMGYAPGMPISFVLEYQEIPIQERLILASIQKASTFLMTAILTVAVHQLRSKCAFAGWLFC